MGNRETKERSNGCIGQAESSLEVGRFFKVLLPDGKMVDRMVFRKQTAYTLKENVLAKKFPYIANYDVVLLLNSKAKVILQDNLEFEDYFNDIDEIHIVPKGAIQDEPADNTSLNGAIHYKTQQ